MNITQVRAIEILGLYQSGKKELFNWCDEYNQFVRDNVSFCVTSEWGYMLKRSYEDNESPCSYEDLDLFDLDKAKEAVVYKFGEMGKDEQQEFLETYNKLYNRKMLKNGDVEVFLNSLNKEELQELCNDEGIDQAETEGEIYEWWIIQDPLKYRLEQEGEIFLNGAWGRQTSGQSISLDGVVQKAFIKLVKDITNRE